MHDDTVEISRAEIRRAARQLAGEWLRLAVRGRVSLRSALPAIGSWSRIAMTGRIR